MNDKDLQQGLQTILSGCSKNRPNGLPVKWVYAIFQRFAERYLTKWTGSIDGSEEIIANEWAKVLRNMTPEQITRGLSDWNGDWPPSAIEFKKACQGGRKNEHGLNYTPQIYRAESKIFTKKDSDKLFEYQKLRLENKGGNQNE